MLFDKTFSDTCEFLEFFRGECVSGNDYLHAINVLEYTERRNNGRLSRSLFKKRCFVIG